MLQKEFPPKVEWFAELTVKLDLGFQGFSDIYCCKKLVIPIKKKRAKKGVKNELTSQELEHNKADICRTCNWWYETLPNFRT
jgi:hypothetical protein